ncbi:MAG: hypothetical protein U0350_21820 [Caldilineaceae bacterium]
MIWLERFVQCIRNTTWFTTLRNRPVARLLLLVIAGLAILIGIWPVYAAVELLDFQVRSSQSDILLLWNTAHEYDLSGFDVMCKPASEPDTAYHSIGFREAQGSPQAGAKYFFLVNQNLAAGQSYCFRLREVTTNDQPGEIFDRCGYGLGITPTATFTATATLTATLTLTTTGTLTGTQPISSATWITGAPLLMVTRPITNPASVNPETPTPSSIITQSATTPTPIGFSPLPTPGVAPSNPITPSAAITNPAPPAPPAVTPNTPVTTTGVATFTATPTLTPSVTPTTTHSAQTNGEVSGASNTSPLTPTASVAATGTLNSSYVIFTATPTPAKLAVLPLMTAVPTVTPSPSIDLAAVAQPSTQNIIILLLCFTFLGASGLGILGLLTSMLYMRSRRAPREW